MKFSGDSRLTLQYAKSLIFYCLRDLLKRKCWVNAQYSRKDTLEVVGKFSKIKEDN